MDYLRGLIDGAVRESQAAWDRSTGYVALTKRQTIDYVKDKKDETTGLVKSKIDHVTEQYSEISNVVTTNIKDIKEEAHRGREQLAPTLEFFHLHPVVSSLSVGFGVQAVRICKFPHRLLSSNT